jgi:hypothetical protein
MARYDKITGETVDKIWDLIHTINEGEVDVLYKLNRSVKRNLHFKLKMQIARKFKITGTDKPFVIDGEASLQRKVPTVEITILLSDSHGTSCYNKLNACLHEIVRHELEHLTQYGTNKRPGKEHASDSKRARVDLMKKPSFAYFSLPDEVPALVYGMYRQAKVEKRPITDIFCEMLDEYISDGEITVRQAKLLFTKWYNYSKKRLPKAQYAQDGY